MFSANKSHLASSLSIHIPGCPLLKIVKKADKRLIVVRNLGVITITLLGESFLVTLVIPLNHGKAPSTVPLSYFLC